MAILTPATKAVHITSPVDYRDTPYCDLPDPKVACDEYPNAPWNTIRYD